VLIGKAAAAAGERYCRVNEKSVYRWERGDVPRANHLRWLAAALELPVDQLTRLVPRDATKREDDDTKRREFLEWTAGALLLCDPEQVIHVLAALSVDPVARPPRVTKRLLDDLHGFADHCGRQWGRVTPRSLLPAVKGNLALLQSLLTTPMTSSLRHQLCLVAAEMAWLAGWLSRQLDNRGDASAYWVFARDLAREIDERPLLAHVLVAASSLHSAVPDRGDGSGETALMLLDEADTVVGSGSQASLRSWILARRGEEAAAIGDATESARAFDRAEQTMNVVDGRTDGILADWDAERLALWRSHCVINLAEDGLDRHVVVAVGVLEHALSAFDASRLYDRSRTMIELAEAHVTLREPDHACALLADCLDLAGDAALVSHVRRIGRVRRRLGPWRQTPAVRNLDERLRLTP
jgi:transcriptional regulator with XRE-family HTH domain